MAQPNDPAVELRSAYFPRGLRGLKYHFPQGSTGVFMRVTLAIIYMYLIFFGYMAMGVKGLYFVSAMFLVALSAPFLYQKFSGFGKQQPQQTDGLGQEV